MTRGDEGIPSPAPAAATVEVDGEPVLLDRSTGSLHMLNDVGAAIWSRVDGSRTVDAIVAELSEVFEAEPDRIAPDVHGFLASLARLGLVEGWIAGDHEPLTRTSNGTSWTIDALWVDWYTAQVIEALRARGVESILLKGPAIRRWLYPSDPEQRGYLDADLLVSASAWRTATAALEELGFEPEEEDSAETISPWAESWRRASDGAVVDLHRTLHGCAHSAVDPWPALRAGAVEEQVGDTVALLPSIPARALQVLLVSPADRPWRRWNDLERVLSQVSDAEWREAAELARVLDVEREFGYRISQAAGPELAQRVGVPVAPPWWLRWETDPLLRWAALLTELPGWRARLRLVRQVARPPAGYSRRAWAWRLLRLVPGAIATLVRPGERGGQASRSLDRS
jgi:putative nucleotidyltransferase-like protein/coenzyme PQQ synthesis protein D (PqqD)